MHACVRQAVNCFNGIMGANFTVFPSSHPLRITRSPVFQIHNRIFKARLKQNASQFSRPICDAVEPTSWYCGVLRVCDAAVIKATNNSQNYIYFRTQNSQDDTFDVKKLKGLYFMKKVISSLTDTTGAERSWPHDLMTCQWSVFELSFDSAVSSSYFNWHVNSWVTLTH